LEASRRIAAIPPNTWIKLLEASDDYYKVRYSKYVGYVSSNQLECDSYPEYYIRVRDRNNYLISDRSYLTAVNDNSIMLRNAENRSQNVLAKDISILTVKKKGKAKKSALIGAAIGFSVGVAFAIALSSSFGDDNVPVVGGILFGAIGSLPGAAFGGIVGSINDPIPINNNPVIFGEKRALLEKYKWRE
jgi:hypothetical protein